MKNHFVKGIGYKIEQFWEQMGQIEYPIINLLIEDIMTVNEWNIIIKTNRIFCGKII